MCVNSAMRVRSAHFQFGISSVAHVMCVCSCRCRHGHLMRTYCLLLKKLSLSRDQKMTHATVFERIDERSMMSRRQATLISFICRARNDEKRKTGQWYLHRTITSAIALTMRGNYGSQLQHLQSQSSHLDTQTAVQTIQSGQSHSHRVSHSWRWRS